MSHDPDIELGATVRAAGLRFERKPVAEVGFSGDPDADTASDTERENLPEDVEPGVTYRDVSVRWRAAARLPEGPEG
jgi:hypothetical protein